MAQRGVPLVIRFWNGVSKRADDECWPWNRGRTKSGYGTTSRPHPSGNGVQLLGTHRVAYELTYGPIPKGRHVCHRCDNPPCCNPNHLFLGTAKDNVRDCIEKNRRSKKRGPYNTGDTNSHAVMTEATARDIIQRVRAGEKQTDIANHLGVDKGTIWRLVSGKTWKHLHSR